MCWQELTGDQYCWLGSEVAGQRFELIQSDKQEEVCFTSISCTIDVQFLILPTQKKKYITKKYPYKM